MDRKTRRQLIEVIALLFVMIVGVLYYIALAQVDNGVAEDFAKQPERLRLHAQQGDGTGSMGWGEMQANVTEIPLCFGGAFLNEEDGMLRIYRTDVTQNMFEDFCAKSANPVELIQCGYSLPQLHEALAALDVYLERAPDSVRDSILLAMLAPRENRVAVYVQDWNVLDQVRLAKALGQQNCRRLYLVRKQPEQVMPQLHFLTEAEWNAADRPDWCNQTIPEQEREKWTRVLQTALADYLENLPYCGAEQEVWRVAPAEALQLVPDSDCLLLRYHGSRPEDEASAHRQEQVLRVLLRPAEACPYPIAVVYDGE